MTLKEAIKRAECFEIDYNGMTEEEVEELDRAIDKVFEAAKKYLELDEQEKKTEWERGYNAGVKIGRKAERIAIIKYLESKTIQEQKEELVAIPYIGETREEKPDREEPKA